MPLPCQSVKKPPLFPEKGKTLKPLIHNDFRVVRREGFEPPAFWSVGCLKAKSESFRLRFVLFTTVRSADFLLFPPSPACSNPILGQKWVKTGLVLNHPILKPFPWQDSQFACL